VRQLQEKIAAYSATTRSAGIRIGPAREASPLAMKNDKNDGARRPRFGLIVLAGPGLLLAATGVGGGDLATASIAGSLLGPAILWAVIVGAFLKFVVTEGLARWQLATGETFLEGVVHRLGPGVIIVFLPYLFLWTFFAGSAQMNACGVALHAIFPFFESPEQGKIVFGMASSIVGIGLVLKGGYELFEKIMRVCIGIMFVTVVLTAILLWPGTGAVLTGLFVPRIPDISGVGLTWTVALIGGIGGTLTILGYGYWLREEGRTSPDDIWLCRVDLGAGYAMTAIFGLAMVIIGSTIEIEGQGTTLLVTLSDQLGDLVGPVGKWVFLIGAFGAVFSSLLGVWQSVPYLFADCWGLIRERAKHTEGEPIPVNTQAKPYRVYLAIIGIVPMIGLFSSFREVQMLYTVTGAMFDHERPRRMDWCGLQDEAGWRRDARCSPGILQLGGA
jgi:Mn2+/Fe2+ NRAMP family transporter